MALSGVRIMSAGKSEPSAELRLRGGRVVAAAGEDRAGVARMMRSGIDFRRGDAAAVARIAARHGVRMPDLEKGERRTVTPDDGALFLLAVMSRYARSTGYSRAEVF